MNTYLRSISRLQTTKQDSVKKEKDSPPEKAKATQVVIQYSSIHCIKKIVQNIMVF
jgi:ABC-type nitrate/sulfonate/bicarbonate transport system ATPase subunit